MVKSTEVRKLALSLDNAEELPHFERTSFRVKKKIFATMSEKENLVCVMLSPVDQSAFCAYDKTVMYPVPNAWGKKGATYVNLKKVKKTMLKDALATAYHHLVTKSTEQKTKRSARRK
jgi:predicted DNA-binding protein (MmcQ/YjbR family)